MEKLEELLDKAINFIVETYGAYDNICESNGEWCAEHCIDTLRPECVRYFLSEVYQKEEE